MDEDTVQVWTAECLEPIRDHIPYDLLLPLMDKIIWAITQGYQSGLFDSDEGSDETDKRHLSIEKVAIAAKNRMLEEEISDQDQHIAAIQTEIAQLKLPCRCDPPGSGEYCNGCCRVRGWLDDMASQQDMPAMRRNLMDNFDSAVRAVRRGD
jgi:hypothetical protein